MTPYTLEIRDEETGVFLFERDILIDVDVYNEYGDLVFDINGYYVEDFENGNRIVEIKDPEIVKTIAVREKKIRDAIECDVLSEYRYSDEYLAAYAG